jgi:hypothetical protein
MSGVESSDGIDVMRYDLVSSVTTWDGVSV